MLCNWGGGGGCRQACAAAKPNQRTPLPVPTYMPTPHNPNACIDVEPVSFGQRVDKGRMLQWRAWE